MLDTFQVYNPLELNNLLKNELVIHRLIFTLQEVNIFFFFLISPETTAHSFKYHLFFYAAVEHKRCTKNNQYKYTNSAHLSYLSLIFYFYATEWS